MKKVICFTVLLSTGLTQVHAETWVKIVGTTGEVKVRRGVEEGWFAAGAGTWLEEIDSILTLEGAEAFLKLESGRTFRLGGNAILDVADFRRVTERELFLRLMSRKIQGIEPREEKTRLRIGNINVVHGERKTDSLSVETTRPDEIWKLERNGAKALYAQDYTVNAILKLDRILAKFPNINDCGEVHFYLGKAFEALDKPGQAIDAFQVVINEELDQDCTSSNRDRWVKEAEQAIKRLSQ